MAGMSFSGLASGIDSAALIEAASEASRTTRVKPNEKRITELQETNAATEELSNKMDLLRATLKGFTTLSGGGVSKTGVSSKESVVTAEASNAAINGGYSVTVNSLAKNHTFSFDATFASISGAVQNTLSGAEPTADRTISFTVGTGAEQESIGIEITDAAYSASDFVTAFNNASSKAQASLVNIGTTASPSYKIVLTSVYEGTEKGTITQTAIGAALTNLVAHSEDAADDAEIVITGIGTITRTTNSITDVIPGVTLNISSLGSATVRIAEDVDTTVSRVQDFIDSYNELVQFVNENNQVTRDDSKSEITNIFAPLASSRNDDSALTALRSALSSSTASGGSAARIFADLGITTDRNGTLKFDSTKLKTAIASEPTSVSDILSSFADITATTSGTIDIYTRFQGLLELSVNNNKETISDLSTRIQESEKQIERQADSMRSRYARLEALMSRLQQQQSSLTSALSGLG